MALFGFNKLKYTNKYYPTQRNHCNSAAQTDNRHGCVSRSRGVVANLHKIKYHRQNDKSLSHITQQPLSKMTTRIRITRPKRLYPQHESPPLLDNAQE
jgi:hypothetical protein